MSKTAFGYVNDVSHGWQLEGTLETPWRDLGRSSIRLVGQPQEGGYKNQVVLSGDTTTYRGHLFWKYRDENDWEVDLQVRENFSFFLLQVAHDLHEFNFSNSGLTRLITCSLCGLFELARPAPVELHLSLA